MLEEMALRIFQLSCFAIASYVCLLQVLEFTKNEDISVFSLRKFNNEIKDKYPSFTICTDVNAGVYDGLSDKNSIYDADKINQMLQIQTSSYQVQLVLKVQQ